MIGTDHFGLAILFKDLLKILLNGLMPEAQQANAQDVTAEQIADGQGINSLAIPGAETPFEVDGPDFIGRLRNRQGSWRYAGATFGPGAPAACQAPPANPVLDGTVAWEDGPGMFPL